MSVHNINNITSSKLIKKNFCSSDSLNSREKQLISQVNRIPLIPPSQMQNENNNDNDGLWDNIINVLDQSTENFDQWDTWTMDEKHKLDAKLFNNSLNINQKWYIINPETSKCKVIFDAILVILLLTDLILSPFEFFVYLSKKQFFMEYRPIVFDSMFCWDIISNFFTGYYDNVNKCVITDLPKICFHYLKFGFFSILVKLYKYPYLITKINHVLQKLLSVVLSNLKVRQQITQWITFFISWLYIIHLFSCVYIFIGWNYEKTWIDFYDIDRDNIYEAYISSVYTLTQTVTTTGYGDWAPKQSIEMWFIMFSEIVNCGWFAYLLTCIMEIMTNKENSVTFKYQNKQINFKQWMNMYMSKVPTISKKTNWHRNEIWDDIEKYFEVFYKTDKNFNWINLFPFVNEMKPLDRKKLLDSAFENILKKFKLFFEGINYTTRNQIWLNCKTRIEIRGHDWLKEGSKIKKIYLIEHGSISVCKNNQELFTWEEGSYFGLEALIKNKSIFNYKVNEKKCKFAILFCVEIDALIEDVLNYDGESYEELLTKARDYLWSNDNTRSEIGQDEEIDYAWKFGNYRKNEEEKGKVVEYEFKWDECEKRWDLVQKQLLFWDKYLTNVA